MTLGGWGSAPLILSVSVKSKIPHSVFDSCLVPTWCRRKSRSHRICHTLGRSSLLCVGRESRTLLWQEKLGSPQHNLVMINLAVVWVIPRRIMLQSNCPCHRIKEWDLQGVSESPEQTSPSRSCQGHASHGLLPAQRQGKRTPTFTLTGFHLKAG